MAGDDAGDARARGPGAACAKGDVSETTRLLNSVNDEVHPRAEVHPVAGKDTWVGAEDFEGLPWWRKPSIYWLIPPWFLFILAFGGTLVPKLNLILDLICKEYFAEEATRNHDLVILPIVLGGENEQCRIPAVQKTAARVTLAMNLIVGLLSAVIVPKLGHLSDMYGRTRWLAVSSAGGLVAEVITIFAAEFPDTLSYRWIVLGSVFDGLAGSFTAGSLLSHSYTSDCTPPSKRGVAFGYIHACLFAGLALGPVLAGYFVEHTGRIVSIFYVTLACHAFFVLFALFVMPESVSRRRQLLSREKYEKELAARTRDGSWLAALRHRNPLAPLRILYKRQPGAPPLFRRNVIALAAIDMLLMGAALGAGTCIILYVKFVFGWKTLESSKYISAVSTVRAFVLLAVLPLINYIFRSRPAARRKRARGLGAGPDVERNKGADRLDLWIIRLALLSDVLGASGYLAARSPALFVAGGMVTAVGGLGSATIQATLTKHVPPDMVGQLLGAVGLLHALSRVLSPLAFNGVYYATLETYPQAIFALLLGLYGLSLVASLVVRPRVYLSEDGGSTPDAGSGRRSSGEEERLL